MKRKILYLVNYDVFFRSHRLPIALAAIRAGYEVHLACDFTQDIRDLKDLGIIVHDLAISRSGTNLIYELQTFIAIYNVIRKLKPDVVHLISIKPVLYGGIACRLLAIKNVIAAVPGLGYVFIENRIRTRVLRFLVKYAYKLSLKSPNTIVIFQNRDDAHILQSMCSIQDRQVVMIPGSGVCLTKFSVRPIPVGTPIVMLVARLLKDKGVKEFAKAAKILKQGGVDVRMVLVGDLDFGNPNTIVQDELDEWVNSGWVEHWGYSRNISEIISSASIVTLPSYREGLPKTLIEAAASGRAVVTSDVPGCRDAIVKDETGILVPVKNVDALAAAIQKLLTNETLLFEMGTAGRALAESKFDIQRVIQTHLELYSN